MKRILYLHAGAEMYGADKVLLELIKGLDSKEFEAHVILPNDGVLVEALRQVGAKVSVLDYPILRRKYFNPKGIADFKSFNAVCDCNSAMESSYAWFKHSSFI